MAKHLQMFCLKLGGLWRRQKLLQDHQQVTVAINTLLGEIENDDSDAEIAHALSKIRQILTSLVRSIYRHKRTPASNVYVFMISSETRQVKPYAPPIQLLPYASLNTNTMRRLLQDIVKAMTTRGMNVVGKYYILLCLWYQSLYML